ncbi:hypothetical protein ABT120_44895 [Nonomuraea angiospora]|uniref:hypothetical protein n=1 Tax=Nonomuraea angiospora TaxID=46172 RepID=UPI0033288BDF
MERVRDDDLGGREQAAIAHRPPAGVAKSDRRDRVNRVAALHAWPSAARAFWQVTGWCRLQGQPVRAACMGQASDGVKCYRTQSSQ